MKLHDWFRLKTEKPLKIVLVSVVVLWTSFAGYEFNLQRLAIEQRLADVERQIALAVAQSNRPFLEFIIESSFRQFDAEAIALCVDQKMEIEINTKSDLCSTHLDFGSIEKKIAGFGNIRLIVKSHFSEKIVTYFSILFAFLFLLLFVLYMLNRLRKDLYADVILPLDRLIVDDHEPKISEIQDIRRKLRETMVLENQLTHANAIVTLSKQVAHDIRSPLSALSMVVSTFTDMPEQQRILLRHAVQRINDIANDLLMKGKQMASQNIGPKKTRSDSATKNLDFGDSVTRIESQNGDADPCSTKQEVILLPALVDSFVSEKRIQFRDLINVKIDSDFRSSFGAFVKGDAKELMRVLSNLVNNSVEALKTGGGDINVAIRAYSTKVQLVVKDNGSGIPPEILAKLGEVGVTFGKDDHNNLSGSGIGVYHAKKTIEAFGGEFTVNSQLGEGTLIEMSLPRELSPAWFPEFIEVAPGTEVFCLDDDMSIHEIWRGRLEALKARDFDITVRHFTLGRDFKKLIEAGTSNQQNRLFLIDYELLGQEKNGLDIIEELGLRESVILVTSRYDDLSIKLRCEALKIKLLPKSLAGFIPLKIVQSAAPSCKSKSLD